MAQFQDSAAVFTGRAHSYAAGRPDYPPALLDALFDRGILAPGRAVADIGSGTGKFTRPLLERGCTVYAVEPNPEMQRRACAALQGLPGFLPIDAPAERTGLPGASVDAITCASAFHWLDARAFAAECRRIARPQAPVALIWNVRDALSPLNRAHAAAFAAHCPRFAGLCHGHDGCAPRLDRFFAGAYRRIDFCADAVQDRAAFVQRSLSSSYALQPQDAGYAALVAALEQVFDRFQTGGCVVVPTRAVVYFGAV